ncbi:uncharacterized protein PAC_10678 [Phialocephala subalpina]|uniref:Zn(2)-C6 fungal-type domain-containing protein n=1 Tax=Phialocephala subalpina TaxID=576137 RepID=A0A1L7X702_9HELO|nr:uncharacterized protein PAC_10678 [Phialocephala subalpina]
MVNTGKPSTGCHMCRKRRIKCDEGRPGCMRCQKSKRACPGYRDPLQLRLSGGAKSAKKQRYGCTEGYDSPDIFSRVFLPAEVSPISNQENVINSINGFLKDMNRFCKPNLTFPLTPPVEERATCFFFANHVLLPKQETHGRGHIDWAIHFGRLEKVNSPFQLALSAASLACYGARSKTKSLLPKAHHQYIKSLKGINAALLDHEAAMDDSILASILLLVSFEQVTLFEMSLNGWCSHIEGAVALVKYRGEESFDTPTGRNLFNSVRELMTIHYMAMAKPIEPSVDWLYHIPANDLERKYAMLNLRLVDLRAENNNVTIQVPRTANSTVRVVELLKKAKTLEKEYREWYNTLPSSSDSAMAWVDNENIDGKLATSMTHPGRVDRYEELGVAYIYNVARSSQILIWSVILRCVAWLSNPADYRISTEYRDASRICRELIQDIVSSIPFFFLYDQDENMPVEDMIRSSCENLALKGASATFLMWPLYVAGASDFATKSQRIFTRGKLAFIAESVGISQATLMLQISLPHPSAFIAQDRGDLPRFSTPPRGTPPRDTPPRGTPTRGTPTRGTPPNLSALTKLSLTDLQE